MDDDDRERLQRNELAKTPWVDRSANAVWSRIVAASPRPEWVPRHTTKRGGKVTVEEFGCGHYGCVMPTSDENVVAKITSDATEAVFVSAALGLGFGEETEGIVRYYGVYELPNEHRGRKTFILWREAATEVGLPTQMRREARRFVVWREGRTQYIDREVEPPRAYSDYEISRIDNLRRYLGLFKDFAGAARDALRRVADPFAMLDEAKRLEDWAWDRGAQIDVEAPRGIRHQAVPRDLENVKGAYRVALALRLCDVVAELMQNTDGSDLIGSTLRYYLGEGILLADVHANNVGKVERTSGWVITDPGHAVGLEERWRNVKVPVLP